MRNILLVGAGQLGSRHLQGLAKLDSNRVAIDVVDPSHISLETAKSRCQEVSTHQEQICYHTSIKTLSTDRYDLVIIATSADIRYQVLKQLIEQVHIKYLVLEKILFQKIDEFELTDQLITHHKIPTWVNHPRRHFSLYKQIRTTLKNANEIEFSVTGGAWGLGCNALHFLDIFEYLCNRRETVIHTDYLNSKLINSKRAGFFEINGKLTGENGASHFSISCFDEPSPILINIASEHLNVHINEGAGEYLVASKESAWQPQYIKTDIVDYQSNLTTKLCEDILFHGHCELPSYAEAKYLHIRFITAMLDHINSFTIPKIDHLPMT